LSIAFDEGREREGIYKMANTLCKTCHISLSYIPEKYKIKIVAQKLPYIFGKTNVD
jgi:hypothetical protein